MGPAHGIDEFDPTRSIRSGRSCPGFMMLQGIEGPLDGAHGVENVLAMLLDEIFHLGLADAMFARAGAFHRQGAADQPFEEGGDPRHLLGIGPDRPAAGHGNCRRRHGRRSARAGPSPRCRAWSRRRIRRGARAARRHRSAPAARRAAGLGRPNRRRAAPPTGDCGPRAWSPIRTAPPKTRPRCRRTARPARRRPAGVPWNSTNSIGVSGRSSLECRLQARTCNSSRSSMRATGMPDWIVMMTASQAVLDRREGADAAANRFGNAVTASR